MFASYRFEEPRTGKVIRISNWSYLLAGLFGALYMLLKAPGEGFLQALGWTIACTLAFASLAMVVTVLPAAAQTVLLVVAPPIVLIVQSVKIVALVRKSYRRRGWIVRQED